MLPFIGLTETWKKNAVSFYQVSFFIWCRVQNPELVLCSATSMITGWEMLPSVIDWWHDFFVKSVPLDLAIFSENRKCSSKPVILHFSTTRTSLVELCRKGCRETSGDLQVYGSCPFSPKS